jgi:hypothetical protein
MTKLHLPSLQAAAVVASATPKEKAPLRLVQIVRTVDGGHAYMATCNGHVAIRCDCPCEVPAPKGTYLDHRESTVTRMQVPDTELNKTEAVMVWAPNVSMRKLTKAHYDEGGWVDLEDLVHWRVERGAREIALGGMNHKLPKEPGLSRLLEVPNLEGILREFIPGNLRAGCAGRLNASYLAVLAEAAEKLADGLAFKGIYGRNYGDTPSMEFFQDGGKEGATCYVDLTAQRADDGELPQAWGMIMPIYRMDKEAIRGIHGSFE